MAEQKDSIEKTLSRILGQNNDNEKLDEGKEKKKTYDTQTAFLNPL